MDQTEFPKFKEAIDLAWTPGDHPVTIAHVRALMFDSLEKRLALEEARDEILALRQQLAVAQLGHSFTREAISDGIGIDEAFAMFSYAAPKVIH